jgi:agmatine deiminase
LKRSESPDQIAIIRFRFNAWAKYPEWHKDDAVPGRAASSLEVPLLTASLAGRDIVLEGGGIEVNGRGTLLTTEECLLDDKIQVRNPGLSKEAIEAALRQNLGVQNILWLGRGIAGDDTHGHVDDLCRFVNAETVVLCSEDYAGDPNYTVLKENRERLEGMRLEDGSRIEVVDLPMPSPISFEGQRLPASYANFYIANAAVLVPTFNDPNDRIALGTLAELFTDRPVIGIHAVDLVWGLGTLHCLTQQQPAVE